MIVSDQPRCRPRVLQLSYACSPSRGSEAAMGWRRALQSAKHFDTWVICEEHEFAGEIRDYLHTHGEIPGLHFVFVPMDRRHWAFGQWHDSLWYFVLHRWHRRAFETAQRLHQRLGFDLVHQVTFSGFREPGYLWKLDAPFVWGPIGGTQNYPWRFLPAAGPAGALREGCRSLLNNYQLRFNRRVRRAAAKAALIMAATTTNCRDFARAQGVSPRLVSDVCIDRLRQCVCREDREGPLRILWSGLWVHHKALHLLIAALARLPNEIRYELRVLGRGPLQGRWQQLAKRLDVDRNISWLGWLPHQEALAQYDWADLFTFTSLRDTTGTVVVEALAAGLPVVCLDHQGVHDVVTPQCGVKIPVTTPQTVVKGLTAAIARLAQDKPWRLQMGQAAVCRARDFLSSVQEDRLIEAYHSVLNADAATTPRENWSKCDNTHEMQTVHFVCETNLHERQAALR